MFPSVIITLYKKKHNCEFQTLLSDKGQNYLIKKYIENSYKKICPL